MVEAAANALGLLTDYQPEGKAADGGARRRKTPAANPAESAGNAVKFTDHGSVGLKLSYRRWRCLKSTTPAPGIAADELARLFEPFERGRRRAAAARAWEATISKMLTDLMGGGRPSAASLARAAYFAPALPASCATPAPASRPCWNSASAIWACVGILIVDNENRTASCWSACWPCWALSCFQAESGAECLAALPPVRRILLFMDLAIAW